jgi:uncharacterized cysteine cluster protein YcgN (CxxCxxCC family)
VSKKYNKTRTLAKAKMIGYFDKKIFKVLELSALESLCFQCGTSCLKNKE